MSTAIYLSQTQAAARLGLTRQRVGALIASGQLRSIAIAGRPVLEAKEVARFSKLERPCGRRKQK